MLKIGYLWIVVQLLLSYIRRTLIVYKNIILAENNEMVTLVFLVKFLKIHTKMVLVHARQYGTD